MSYAHNSPHDSYFVNMMEIKPIAESFFLSHLPLAIGSAIDWPTLALAESARRHAGRKTTYTDITYQCFSKKEGQAIFLHAEQQRNPDPSLVERILRYNLGLYSQYRKQGNKKLPIIINFVVYNNPKASLQPYPLHARDYFSIPWMADLLRDQFFYLSNLKQTDDVTLASHGPCFVMEVLLKRAGDANFIEWLKGHPILVEEIKLKDVFELSLSYALFVGKTKPDVIIETFTALYPQYKETIMTAARQLKKEGREEGRKVGREEGRKVGREEGRKVGREEGRKVGREEGIKGIAKSMFSTGYQLQEIVRLTGLTKKELEQLLQTTIQ